MVTLVTLEDETAVDKTLLRVLDEAGQVELAEAEAAIQELGLDEAAQAYLLAQLYRGWDMRAAAIAQLERLAKEGVPSTDLLRQLGDLYFEVGLYAQAEESYEAALAAGEAGEDESAQAVAHVGLARVAHAFRENEQALDHFASAEALYHLARETEWAERVAEERARLEK